MILNLEESYSFARTHEIVEKCLEHTEWSQDQTNRLCNIARINSQVSMILNDDTIKKFYNRILRDKNTKPQSLNKINGKYYAS